MAQYPHIVLKYIEYESIHKFDQIKLKLILDSGIKESNDSYGSTIALIRHRSPIIANNTPL